MKSDDFFNSESSFLTVVDFGISKRLDA